MIDMLVRLYALPSAEQAALGGLRTQLWVPIEVEGELFGGFQFFDRRELDAVQKRLREVKGVSVLVYDQVCATEKRRRRKREARRAFPAAWRKLEAAGSPDVAREREDHRPG